MSVALIWAALTLGASPTSCACPCAQPAQVSTRAPGSAAPLPVAGAGSRDGEGSRPLEPISLADPFRRPSRIAFDLNREGRDLYRKRQWPAAREKYRAAHRAESTFLGPRLNIACAYAQEERFAEAVNEAIALVQTAYVPWARQVREAADLAPLQTRPERARLQAAITQAGIAWGSTLQDALLFIARTDAPVRLPPLGVLHLGLAQEIFAWMPSTGRYRQVTADDGRVLAFARSLDGRRVAYLRAGKLIRQVGGPELHRDLSLRILDLPTMTLGRPLPLPADLAQVELAFDASGELAVRVSTPALGTHIYQVSGDVLISRPDFPKLPPGLLDQRAVGLGVKGHPVLNRVHYERDDCPFVAKDVRPDAAVPAVAITPQSIRSRWSRKSDKTAKSSGAASKPAAPFRLKGPWGAGLQSLPFPK